MWKRLKEKWKNKKGFGSIEIVISSMIVIMIVAGLVDMIQITQRLDTTSQAVGYVSRVVQKQGGVQDNRIPNFNGKYTPTHVLYDNVKSMMDANNIPEDEWKLTLTAKGSNYDIQPTTNVPLVDYGKRITITLEVDYHWNTLSSMLPGEIGGSRDSSRQVLSGYQVRNTTNMESDLNVN